MTLNDFNQMYEEIRHSKLSRNQKDRMFAQIMTLMEQTYRIPMLRSLKWEEENKEVITLYRTISYSRKLRN